MVGFCATHTSTNLKKAVLNGNASAVAMHPPQRNAAANSHGSLALAPVEKPQHRERHQSEQARKGERPKEHLGDVRRHAAEQTQLDERRKSQHHQQRRADRNAYAAPPQRGAHEEAVVARMR